MISPNTPVSSLKDFAAAVRGYHHPWGVQEGAVQFATKLRRLTDAQMESVDYTDKVKPPEIPGAPADAPYAERFNLDDEGYNTAYNAAYQMKVAGLIHLGVEGGIEGEDDAARVKWLEQNLPRSIRNKLAQAILSLAAKEETIEMAGFFSPAG